jgi:ribonuclease HII
MDIKIGIDEAGRGPWAGPVFAGLVVLTKEQQSKLSDLGINDSKKLSVKKRDSLYPAILENSTYCKVKYLSAEDIDKIGIYKATQKLIQLLACDLATNMPQLFTNPGTNILIDGQFPGLKLLDEKSRILSHECIIKGDEKEPSISAASILAKVRRDEYMTKLALKYPNYQFEKHKGYGTKLHMEMLQKYGLCEEHRRSFKPIQKFL